jgi:hypothetical protein
MYPSSPSSSLFSEDEDEEQAADVVSVQSDELLVTREAERR